MLLGGGPSSSSWSWPRGGVRTAVIGGTPCSLAACRGRALLGGGSPPYFPPLAAAHIKRAQPFGGSSRLISNSIAAACGEYALLGLGSFLRLHSVLFTCGPMPGRAPWVSRVSWVGRRPRWRQ